MSSISRRNLRPTQPGVRARQMLGLLRAGTVAGDAAAVIRAAPMNERWAWQALAQLLELGLISKGADGALKVTARGRQTGLQPRQRRRAS